MEDIFIWGSIGYYILISNAYHLLTESEVITGKSHHLTPRSADVILVQIETIKSFEINLTYMLDYIH